jgi:hypothetical protein
MDLYRKIENNFTSMIKNWVILCYVFIVIGATACHSSVEPDAYTTDLSQGKMWVIGEWSLNSLSTMSGNTFVPDLKVVFDRTGQMTVIENGKQIDKVRYAITEDAYNMLLEPVVSSAQVPSEWYQVKSILKVSKVQLYLYVDPSSDSPIYIFKRIR